MSPTQFSKIILRSRPVADIIPSENFQMEHAPLSSLVPGAKQVLVKVTYLSLDPAMRGWLRDERSYMPPVQIGETMRAGGLGVVVKAGEGSKFAEGDTISGFVGWAEYAVVDDDTSTKVEPPKGTDALDFLNTLGFPGLTAYFGLNDIGRAKKGETLVVSGAAGAVGSVVCQLGKRLGCTVIAIAGSPDKCEWLEKDLGVDKALNYKSPTFHEDWAALGYLDVFFDNVGGDILDFALTRLNRDARIVLCGCISQYNAAKPAGITAYSNLIAQRASMTGFGVFGFAERYPEAIADIGAGVADGSIKRKFHIVDGLAQAPEALCLLFTGGNTGKLVVKVSDGPIA
ncbi:NAD(P)-binding protein [Athelia psychrophila]|uniref:NAD(P)-binding protein n=1 Tax=Athelia psychrophila TaxID=1759441 RepID=A0A166UJ32_9AGAM|nr:NAD(P)-binding protein [Fibularhizoctonia sp. CBS 109695]